MKNALKVMLIAGMVSWAGVVKADTQKSVYTNGKNMFGYSIVNDPVNLNMVAAGTLSTPGNPATDTADIEVVIFDRFGDVRSTTRINGGKNEYCYNINYYDLGLGGQGFILSGASLEGTIIRPHIWLIDRSGNLLNHKVYTSGTDAGAALHAFTTQDGKFLVSGFINRGVAAASSKQGMVLKLNANLTISWQKFLNTTVTPSNDWDMCEFGIETNSGYFITGSRNASGTPAVTKSVLALWLNKATGALVADRSFRSSQTTFAEVGASACYEATTDQLFLLSNNSAVQSFVITKFTGTTQNSSWKYGQLANTTHAYGYSIKFYNATSSELLVTGMVAGVNITDAQSNVVNSKVPFIASISRSIGLVNFDYYLEIPNVNFSNYGAPLLTLGTTTGMPTIFTPEMLYTSSIGTNYFLGYRREYNANYRLELIGRENNGTEPTCSYYPVDLYDIANPTSTQTAITISNGNLTLPAVPELIAVAFPKPRINCFEAPCVNVVANAGADNCCFAGYIVGTPSLAGATYSWAISAGGGLSSTTIAQPTVTAPGTFTLTMTNRCGEVSTDVVVVTGACCRLGATETNTAAANAITVYPNPGNGEFTFTFTAEETDVVQLRVLDLSGREVANRTLSSTSAAVSLTELTDGIYIYQLSINGAVQKQDRLIIAH